MKTPLLHCPGASTSPDSFGLPGTENSDGLGNESLCLGCVCQKMLPSKKIKENQGRSLKKRDREGREERSPLGCCVCVGPRSEALLELQICLFRTKEDAAVWGSRKGWGLGLPSTNKKRGKGIAMTFLWNCGRRGGPCCHLLLRYSWERLALRTPCKVRSRAA